MLRSSCLTIFLFLRKKWHKIGTQGLNEIMTIISGDVKSSGGFTQCTTCSAICKRQSPRGNTISTALSQNNDLIFIRKIGLKKVRMSVLVNMMSNASCIKSLDHCYIRNVPNTIFVEKRGRE